MVTELPVDLTLRDARALSRHFDTQKIVQAQQRFAFRKKSVPALSFSPELPINTQKELIAATISENQVTVIAGETGSGKTTQIPQICLELGRGISGAIGHTQPRRLAARTVASRIAEETQTELGTVIGYTVRFTDKASKNTLVRVMTDGILLREIARDRDLLDYDTIIIDEAHERSLNIDLLLGYLRELLPRRPDLKIIITSATIDPQRFADHFASAAKPVPIIEVSGRTYPVEIRYRPLKTTDFETDNHHDRDQLQAISAAVDELMAEGPGDILVFLATERDIRDTAKGLKYLENQGITVLPLFARLSTADQQRVFSPHRGRRIVLSTNVAETSVTVPSIHYVIDTGFARISRYSNRTKIQRLPIEPISQASAQQRSGRCGRIAEGVTIRLYSEEDFNSRPQFTDPEIVRTNLASVILTMTSLGLKDISEFPFLERPDNKSITDGLTLLAELGAIKNQQSAKKGNVEPKIVTLTPIGKKLSTIPVEPRFARMMIEGNTNGCLHEILIIVAALSIPDVRERPPGKAPQADQLHARFTGCGSDFLSYLQLWDHLADLQKTLSSNQFSRTCEKEMLHWLRIREWRDLVNQLESIAKQLHWDTTPKINRASPDLIHQSILAGLLTHIGLKDELSREFLGTRGSKFSVFPGSALAKNPPQWVMAAEIVETSKLWGRTIAPISPEWAEKLGAHLISRRHSEPRWSSRRASAVCTENVNLLGVPLIHSRTVNLGKIDPIVARELFIRHALIDGEWRSPHQFIKFNAALISEIEEQENRSRRRDLAVDDDVLVEFFNSKIPETIISGAHFDSWWKKQQKQDTALLNFPRELIFGNCTEPLGADYPGFWQQANSHFRIEYRFDPIAPDDGTNVLIPVELLPHVRSAGFDWQVPGFRNELVVELIRKLPKNIRRALPPATEVAKTLLQEVKPRSQPLATALSAEISRIYGLAVNPRLFSFADLPTHCTINFRIIDAAGTTLLITKSLRDARNQLLDNIVTDNSNSIPATPSENIVVVESWTNETVGSLPEKISVVIAGQEVTTYPGLAVSHDGKQISTATFVTAVDRDSATTQAINALLFRENTRTQSIKFRKQAVNSLSTELRLALAHSPYDSDSALFDDITRAALRDSWLAVDVPTTFEEYQALAHIVDGVVVDNYYQILRHTASALLQYGLAKEILFTMRDGLTKDDVKEQLSELIFPQFISATATSNLQHLARYCIAAQMRLNDTAVNPKKDEQGRQALNRVIEIWINRVDSLSEAKKAAANEKAIWLIEELRVQLFAQRLGTALPVSEKKIIRLLSVL